MPRNEPRKFNNKTKETTPVTDSGFQILDELEIPRQDTDTMIRFIRYAHRPEDIAVVIFRISDPESTQRLAIYLDAEERKDVTKFFVSARKPA